MADGAGGIAERRREIDLTEGQGRADGRAAGDETLRRLEGTAGRHLVGKADTIAARRGEG